MFFICSAVLKFQIVQDVSHHCVSPSSNVADDVAWEAQVSQFLQIALEACSKGVTSCHSVPAHVPGALLAHLLKAATPDRFTEGLVHTA